MSPSASENTPDGEIVSNSATGKLLMSVSAEATVGAALTLTVNVSETSSFAV